MSTSNMKPNPPIQPRPEDFKSSDQEVMEFKEMLEKHNAKWSARPHVEIDNTWSLWKLQAIWWKMFPFVLFGLFVSFNVYLQAPSYSAMGGNIFLFLIGILIIGVPIEVWQYFQNKLWMKEYRKILQLLAIQKEEEFNKIDSQFANAKKYLYETETYEKKMIQFKKDLRNHERIESLNEKMVWMQMSGTEFEEELAKLLKERGFNVQLTKHSGDGGVDIILLRNNIKTIIQCKAHCKPVSAAPLRQLNGVKSEFKAKGLVFASTSGVTKDAREFAERHRIQVWDAETICSIANNKIEVDDYGTARWRYLK